jgi:DNA-binding NtrC family response regulator
MSLIEPKRQPAVLVVEDEVLILVSVAEELRDAGFKVLEASNADAALVVLEAHPEVTILFTDIDMPGSMDGLKLSAAVRKRWPAMQIIVTSGHMKVRQEDLPDAGQFFAKPYDLSRLISTMQTLATGS